MKGTPEGKANTERLAQLEGSFIHKLWGWKKELIECVRTMDVGATAQDCLNRAADVGFIPPPSVPSKGEYEKSKPNDAWKKSTATPEKMEEVMCLSSVLLAEQLKKDAAKTLTTAPAQGAATEADKSKMSKFLEFYKSHRQRSLKSRMEKLKSMQESAADILQSGAVDPMTQTPTVPSPFPSTSIASTMPYPSFNPEMRERFSELVNKCMHEIEEMENDVLRRNTDYDSIMSKLREMAIVDNPRVKRARQEGGAVSLPLEGDDDDQIGSDDQRMDTEVGVVSGVGMYLGRGEGRGLPTLVEFCLRKCVALAEYLPPLEGCLSEDLLQALLHAILEEDNKLAAHPFVLKNLLDSTMTTLSLSSCRHIDDRSCEWVAERCHLLKRLNLSFCKGITKGQSVSGIISACPSLEAINLQGCAAVGDESVFEISMQLGTRLRVVNLGGLSVTDEALGGLLLRCPNIVELRLQGCMRITDASMYYLEHVAGLIALDISRCEGVTDVTLCRLGDCCHSLREFRANDQGSKRITDKGVCRLASGCKELRIIELTGCDGVTDAAIDFLLGECIYLMELGLPSCKGVKTSTASTGRTKQESNVMEDAGEIRTVVGGKNVKTLNLSGCVNIEDGLLEMISVACPNLEAIDLSSCENVTDEGLMKLGKRCGANLVSLVLERCLGISDASLSAFMLSSRLTCLNLERCRGLTDSSMVKVLRMCTSLEDVDLSLCDGIGDDTIISLSKNCLNVKRLILRDLPQLTESGVSAISGLEDLRELRLTHNTTGATEESIGCIVDRCRELTVLDLSNCTNICRLDSLFGRMSSFQFLEELYLRGWSQWKTEAFLGAGKRLKVLDISWSKNVEDEALSRVSMEVCPSLAALDIAYCKELSGVAVHNLIKRCYGLREVGEEGGDGGCADRRLRSVNLRGCPKMSLITLRYLTALGLVVLR